MTAAEQAETLLELSWLRARWSELQWRVLADADRDEVGAGEGYSSTAAWVAARTRETGPRCQRDLRGARLLDDPLFETTRAALAVGDLTADRMGLCDLVEHLPTDKLPQAGGTAATVVVSMDLDRLRGGLGAGMLDPAVRISPGQVRRFACDAGWSP